MVCLVVDVGTVPGTCHAALLLKQSSSGSGQCLYGRLLRNSVYVTLNSTEGSQNINIIKNELREKRGLKGNSHFGYFNCHDATAQLGASFLYIFQFSRLIIFTS